MTLRDRGSYCFATTFVVPRRAPGRSAVVVEALRAAREQERAVLLHVARPGCDGLFVGPEGHAA